MRKGQPLRKTTEIWKVYQQRKRLKEYYGRQKNSVGTKRPGRSSTKYVRTPNIGWKIIQLLVRVVRKFIKKRQ
jgi:hypothetical protein